jgi:hypothetical protein
MLNDLADARHGRAFEGFTQQFLASNPANRPQFEAVFTETFGASFLKDWQDWRRRRGYSQ